MPPERPNAPKHAEKTIPKRLMLRLMSQRAFSRQSCLDFYVWSHFFFKLLFWKIIEKPLFFLGFFDVLEKYPSPRKTTPNAKKIGGNRPKINEKSPKNQPLGAPESPRATKNVPRVPKKHPRTPTSAPKRPKYAQERPKSHQEAQPPAKASLNLT